MWGNSKRPSSQKSEQDLKMEIVASSLYLTGRDRQGKAKEERQKEKLLKANTCKSTKTKACCSQKENELFKAGQHRDIFKAAVSQCCMELYLGLIFISNKKTEVESE